MAEAKNLKLNLSSEKPVFSWESPEFIRYKREKKWFLYLAVVSIGLIAVFWSLHQWSGAVLVFVACLVSMTLSGTKAKTIKCAIYSEGFVLNSKAYGYAQFKAFWLGGSPDLPKIHFAAAGFLSPQITMPLGQENPEQIALFVSKHLPQEESRGEDFLDIINRLLRM